MDEPAGPASHFTTSFGSCVEADADDAAEAAADGADAEDAVREDAAVFATEVGALVDALSRVGSVGEEHETTKTEMRTAGRSERIRRSYIAFEDLGRRPHSSGDALE